jgi:ABC-type branched-subunit amino acid transport system ATPase component
VTDAPLLRLEEITVRFGGVAANDMVSLHVDAGCIAALLGPNGAGKTTLFNVITGALRPTAGRVVFDGRDITRMTRVARGRAGIARTFQNLALVDELTATDNVAVGLGRFRRTGLAGAISRIGHTRSDDRRIRSIATEALDFVGIADRADVRASDLPYGDRRRVELARALAQAPRLVLLDEPTAGMGPGETAALATTIRSARDELGVTVFVVEHDMGFVRAVADTTSVLDLGAVIATGATESVLQEAQVVEAYLGTTA